MKYIHKFYTMRYLSLFCIEEFFIYVSCSGVVLPLHPNYICVGIDMFVHHITVSEFVYVIQPNCWFYSILGIFYYISPMFGLFFHCIVVTFELALIFLWMSYICLLQHVGVLHNIYSLVLLHIGNIVSHILCILFVMPFLPS